MDTLPNSRVKLDWSINLGTAIHLVVLVGAIFAGWAAFERRISILEYQVAEQGKTVQQIKSQTNRIERYLMSQDPGYWRKAKENESD